MVLRWGIVTAGKISHDFVNALNSYPNLEDQAVVAVAARNEDRAREFANLHGINKVFKSYRDMAESKDIDIAYIGALNPNHYELAELYLNNNKHVLCEKPLCMNFDQSKKLTDLAKEKKLFLMEAVWSRFFPAYIALEEEIDSGKLGDVMYVQAKFGVPIADIDRVSKKELGGSVILDLGVYVLQFAQFIFKDEPIKVTASGILNENGVDIVDTVILDYSNGRRAVLTAHGKTKLINNATVTGTKGHATLLDPFHAPVEVILANGETKKYPLHKSNLSYNFTNSAGLVYQAIEVKKYIDQGCIESPRMSHKDSLIFAKLQDTIRKQCGVDYDF